MNDLLERSGMPYTSTDWTKAAQELQEEHHVALWERQMGRVALDDSVRITTEDSVRITALYESVRITASAGNRDF